ncbi:MAG: DUF2142 domain-containing protein [Acidimicrobiales bacterium]|nr:DUF2142 domain-containing protein [Acidimicrobiales bacterium]
MKGDRRWWWAVFVLGLVVGTTWALSVPPSGGPDEPAHIVKAVGVARGDLSTDVDWHPGWIGPAPKTSIDVPNRYAHSIMIEQTSCWMGVEHQPSSCAPPLADDAGAMMTTSTYVGAYQPAYYALTGLPTRFLPPAKGVFAARLVSVAIGAALAASAWASARRLGPSTIAGTVLALTPAVVYLSSTVNPQGPEILAAIAVWVTGLLVLSEPNVERRILIRLGVAATVLVSARPTGVVLAVLIVGALVVTAADRASLRSLWQRRSVRWMVGAMALAFAANALHVVATDALNSVMKTGDPPSSSEAVDLMVDALPRLLSEQVGLLSWSGFVTLNLPPILVRAWLAAVAALVAAAVALGSVRQKLMATVLVVAWAAMPVVGGAMSPEVGWQGRYGLPVGVGIPIVAGWAIDRWAERAVSVRPGLPRRKLAAGALFAATALSGLCLLAGQAKVMSRNLHGQPSSTFASRDARWNGPLTPNLLFAGALAGSVVLTGSGAIAFARELRRTDGAGAEEAVSAAG